jgi:hypothetical protein
VNRQSFKLLLNYGRKFLGYGNPDAPYWFVGLEEAGVKNLAKLFRGHESKSPVCDSIWN